MAVEANVERVVARLFAVEEALPAARPRIVELAGTLTPQQGAGDFIQAMMDLGQTICTPRSPDCARCPLTAHCAAFLTGEPERYPVKAAKAARPRREGTAYWLEHQGRVLLVRRQQRGLLGGMLGLPTDEPPQQVPVAAQWCDAGAVDHVFTHFALTMRLLCAEPDAEPEMLPPEAVWWPVEHIQEAGLPTLFAKLAARGAEWRQTA